MYYLQSRYYNPTWGRFINADAFVSTGQGILGNNMFAYCLNNPVSCSDPSGTCAFGSNKGIGNQFAATYDCGCGGVGGGLLFVDFTVLDTMGGLISGADDWIEAQKDAIIEKLKKSLAKATKKEYRTEYEEHHMVAKKASNAARAAQILNEVLPGGVEDPLNKVMVKSSVHRRIHTKTYYWLTNLYIISAYSAANGNVQQQYANVIAALNTLRIFIESLNAYSIN